MGGAFLFGDRSLQSVSLLSMQGDHEPPETAPGERRPCGENALGISIAQERVALDRPKDAIRASCTLSWIPISFNLAVPRFIANKLRHLPRSNVRRQL